VSPLSRREALLLAAAAVASAAGPASAAAAAAPGDMSLGNPKAPVHIVEYLSLSCPHCAHFNEEVFPTLKAKYVDTGKVYYTVRELLTPPAQVAAAGFLLARCNAADAPRYFKVVDEVLRSQKRWQSGNIKPIFVEIGQANGVSEAQFNACLSDEAAQDALDKRIQYAVQTDKVTGTPAFFVNGVALDNGSVPTLAELEAAIAKAAKGGRR
jgi:protein-disulfide isomerase